jgi:hypothetical protein
MARIVPRATMGENWTLGCVVLRLLSWQVGLSCPGVLQHDRGAFLADHDRGRVRVAARNLRHDRGVGDAQPLDAVDAQPWIDDGIDLAPHAAGADRVHVGDAAEEVIPGDACQTDEQMIEEIAKASR